MGIKDGNKRRQQKGRSGISGRKGFEGLQARAHTQRRRKQDRSSERVQGGVGILLSCGSVGKQAGCFNVSFFSCASEPATRQNLGGQFTTGWGDWGAGPDELGKRASGVGPPDQMRQRAGLGWHSVAWMELPLSMDVDRDRFHGLLLSLSSWQFGAGAATPCIYRAEPPVNSLCLRRAKAPQALTFVCTSSSIARYDQPLSSSHDARDQPRYSSLSTR